MATLSYNCHGLIYVGSFMIQGNTYVKAKALKETKSYKLFGKIKFVYSTQQSNNYMNRTVNKTTVT